MGLAQDLLIQANHLATYQGTATSQAALRRSVSTAYYALFHLLTGDAAGRWHGSAEAVTALERALQHGPMKISSTEFAKILWTDWHGNSQRVPPALQRVARAFLELQEERHTADYNNHEQWTATDVQRILHITATAFQDWASIRNDPMAGNYLLSMLVKKRS